MRDYYLSVINQERKGFIPLVLCAILRGLSWVYAGIVALMRWVYDKRLVPSYDLGRPVISVGNLTWGGVGKTPLVEYLVRECLAISKNPVVLMRGYMAQTGDVQSDEAQLLIDAFDAKVPVIAQKDRVQGALKVPQDYAHDVFILDDGFQHWRVKRDLDIVVIDAMNPFGNGAVIPRGSMREHFSALSKADIIVITKSDLGHENLPLIDAKLKRYCPNAKVVKSNHGVKNIINLKTNEEVAVSNFTAQTVLLASAIGNPKGFEETVEGLNIDVRDHLTYPDHYVYTKLDIEKISYELEKYQISTLVVTSKDAVKLRPLIDLLSDHVTVYVLNISIVIQKGEEVLRDEICRICHH